MFSDKNKSSFLWVGSFMSVMTFVLWFIQVCSSISDELPTYLMRIFLHTTCRLLIGFLFIALGMVSFLYSSNLLVDTINCALSNICILKTNYSSSWLSGYSHSCSCCAGPELKNPRSVASIRPSDLPPPCVANYATLHRHKAFRICWAFGLFFFPKNGWDVDFRIAGHTFMVCGVWLF